MGRAARKRRFAPTAMTTTLIVCGAVLAAMALAATVFLLGRRGSASEDRLAAMAAEFD